MSYRNLVIITKIILFYSVFYMVMKLIAIIGGSWPVPNLVLMIPYLMLAIAGWILVKKESYSWWYVAAGAFIIIFTRIYETQFSLWLQHQYIS